MTPTSGPGHRTPAEEIQRSSSPASISHRGYALFLAFPEDGEVTLIPDRIDAAARWDGLHAILVHGNDDLTPEAAIARYHQLSDQVVLPHEQA